MLTMILLFLILSSASIYLTIEYDKKIEETIPFSIFSLIIIIYLFGLINLLKFGVYFVIFISLILYIISFIILLKKKNIKKILKNCFSPGFIIWCLAFILLYLFYKGRMLVQWDEFSHWGDVVKMMYYNNVFSTNPISMSTFQSYPPAMSIFQYFVQIINGDFTEHYLFISYQLFGLSLFMPFLKYIKWKDYYKIILYLILILLVPMLIFSNYYTTIYIDAILSMTFAFTMTQIFIAKEYDIFTIITISLSLIVLTLIKNIAPLLSFFCLGLVFIDLIFVKKSYILLKNINKNRIKQFINRIKPGLIFLIVILVTYISWQLNIRLNGATISFENSSSIKSVIKALIGRDNSYMTDVIKNYIFALSNRNISSNYNIYFFSSIMVLFSYLIYKKEPYDNKKKGFNLIIILFIGETIYVGIMLFVYLLKFTEYEAILLASWERYIGIYLNAILFFIVYIIIYRFSKNKVGINLFLLVLFVISNDTIPKFTSLIYNRNIDTNNTISMRESYTKISKKIETKIGNNKKHKIYIIVQNTKGFEKWILRYSMRNIVYEINEGMNWSLGEKYYDGDIWTLNISKEKLKRTLFKENYEYIYLHIVDNKFVKTYGTLFNNSDIKNEQIYKINKITETIDLVK